ANPLATLGRIIRRRRLRRERNGSGGSNGVDGIVSFGYSLHVVEKGFEVQLDGVFVWGRDVDRENPQPFDVGYALATCELLATPAVDVRILFESGGRGRNILG
ncbi:unnamed protein product, partial [Ectocarpus sp. 4 AP-2014]